MSRQAMGDNIRIESYITRIQHTIVVASLNYDIWRIYKNNRYREMLLEVDDIYPLFFKTSIHAHFVAMTMALYRLFETRNDTINFFSLLILIEQSRKLNNREMAYFRIRAERLKTIWVKICILRNKVFGHLTNNLEINPWCEAKITPNQIKKMIRKCQKLINDISYKWNRSAYAFNLSAKYDICNLLKNLRTRKD